LEKLTDKLTQIPLPGEEDIPDGGSNNLKKCFGGRKEEM